MAHLNYITMFWNCFQGLTDKLIGKIVGHKTRPTYRATVKNSTTLRRQVKAFTLRSVEVKARFFVFWITTATAKERLLRLLPKRWNRIKICCCCKLQFVQNNMSCPMSPNWHLKQHEMFCSLQKVICLCIYFLHPTLFSSGQLSNNSFCFVSVRG